MVRVHSSRRLAKFLRGGALGRVSAKGVAGYYRNDDWAPTHAEGVSVHCGVCHTKAVAAAKGRVRAELPVASRGGPVAVEVAQVGTAR